jgi:hypothetical protein
MAWSSAKASATLAFGPPLARLLAASFESEIYTIAERAAATQSD